MRERRQGATRRKGMTGSTRLAAAISAGCVPAIAAFVVLFVIDRNLVPALVTAAIVWVFISALMWTRFG